MKYRDFLVFLLVIFAVLKLEGALLDLSRGYNACFMDRFLPGVAADPFLSSAIFDTTILAISLMLVQLCLWQEKKPVNPKSVLDYINWESAFATAYTLIWYMSCYCILDILKDTIGDQKCSKHANSISGHFSFHVFYFFVFAIFDGEAETRPYQLEQLLWLVGSPPQTSKSEGKNKRPITYVFHIHTFFILDINSDLVFWIPFSRPNYKWNPVWFALTWNSLALSH